MPDWSWRSQFGTRNGRVGHSCFSESTKSLRATGAISLDRIHVRSRGHNCKKTCYLFSIGGI